MVDSIFYTNKDFILACLIKEVIKSYQEQKAKERIRENQEALCERLILMLMQQEAKVIKKIL